MSNELIVKIMVQWVRSNTTDCDLLLSPHDYRRMALCPQYFMQYVEANPQRVTRFNEIRQQL